MKAEETVDYHIKTAWYSISRMYNVNAMKVDMSMAVGYVLLNIDKNGTPATKIAPLLGLEPRSLTRMLKTLEEKGWIRRETDATDRRVVNVFLTDEGKKKRDFARQGVIEFNNAIYQQVGEEKLQVFFDVIKEIQGVVDAENANLRAYPL
ncbi:MAG: MarR family transcriptional regulator [Siphonobacter sp.]